MPNTFTDYTWTQSEARLVANSLLDSNGNVTFNECHMPYTNKTSENFTIAVNLVRWKVFLNPDRHPRPGGELQRHADERRLSVGGDLYRHFHQHAHRVVLELRRLRHLHRSESEPHLHRRRLLHRGPDGDQLGRE